MSIKRSVDRVKRTELKYFFSSTDMGLIKQTLDVILMPDPYNVDENGYVISSVYFDTIDDDDLNQKLDGIMYREKYRIRIYNNDTNSGKFEIKRKLNNAIEKLSININQEEISLILSGDFSPLEKYKTVAYAGERMKYKGYVAKNIVTYNRLAFFLPFNNIRITLDLGLRTHGFETNLLNIESLLVLPIQKNGYEILEIKYEGKLPDFIKNIISSFHLNRSSISKYGLSRIDSNTEINGDDPLISF